jgi:fused signal recognition particle receptor
MISRGSPMGMFDSLKDKLNIFKKKAAEEIEEEEKEAAKKAQAAPGPEKPAPKPVERPIPKPTPTPKPVAKPPQPERPAKVVKVQKVKVEDTRADSFTDGLFGWRLNPAKIEELLADLEVILMESDVALPVVDAIKEAVKEDLKDKKIKFGANSGEVVEESLRLALKRVLKTEKRINLDEYIETHEKPISIMFVGVNGTGKTTTIAKVAYRYLQKGKSVVIAAADTFRAGAIEQLEIHAERLGVKLIKHQAGSDPAAVAYDAIEHAKARKRDLVLIDTAGRMQTNTNLMDEMKKIKRVVNPDLILFIGDSLAGNDATEQAREFEKAVRIDGAILSKIDADAKGGAAISVAKAVGKPILFVGTGQEYKDLEPFSSKWLVERLFGKAGMEEKAE